MADITVYNFDELKNAITDSTSTYIILANDITFTSTGGAVIPKTKGDITIDGQGYKITDRASGASGDTLRVSGVLGPAITVTVKNTVWNGRNFYGMVQIADNTTYNNNVTLQLDGVRYTGPQAIHNRAGITRIKDSTFSIEKNGSPDAIQELGEINRLYIAGTVTVNKIDSNAVVWFCNTGTALTVEADAVFTVTTKDNYMFYSDASAPAMTFGENSVTDITTLTGLYLYTGGTLHTASSFTLQRGASFKATRSQRNGSVPMFNCYNVFLMEEDSRLYLADIAGGTSALMHFSARAVLNFNNPKSVVLYNNGGPVFSFAAGSTANPDTINVDAELLNIWQSAAPYAVAGGFDNPPTRAVRKADGSNITAVINTSTTATTAINSNIASGDEGYPLTTSTFNVMSARVLSMGNLRLSVDEITDLSVSIKGMTEQEANLRASYNAIILDGRAETDGSINLPLPSSIAPDTALTFGSNWKFLTKYIAVTTKGSVSITHLQDLIFKTFAVPYPRNIVPRTDTDWYVEVTDTRTSGGDWYLYVALPAPLTHGSDTIDDGVILAETARTEILSPTPVLVRREVWRQPPAVTQIKWEEIEGFLLKVIPDYLYNGGKYTSEMSWQIRLEPLD